MFDTRAPFRARIGTDEAGNPIVGKLNYPSDAQWCERSKRHPSIDIQVKGRERKSADVDTSAFDLKLIDRLWLPDSPTVSDGYHAAQIINTLDRARKDTVERAGSSFKVTLIVYGRDEEHEDGLARVSMVLREPTKRQVKEFFSASSKSTRVDADYTTTSYLEPGGKLFDELVVSTEGYADGSPVPINHKNAALLAVIVESAQMNEVDNLPPEA